MRHKVKLTHPQWKTLTTALSNIGQAVILFSLAAFFVPQAVNLPNDFSKGFSVLIGACYSIKERVIYG